ncbi:MAG: acyl--CoA ligase [Halieaceae bacterium]|jgi:fatty-acyl-CoA synthase|nr:acyl--CoA ligase [Halieaceae bacterium]
MQLQLLHHEIEYAAQAYGEKIALTGGGDSLSFEQLSERSGYLAAALPVLGVNRGDRLAILAHNCVDYIVWHYAAARAGVIFHVLNTRLVQAELSWMLKNAGSVVLIADADFSALARDLQSECEAIHSLIGIGQTDLDHPTDDLAGRCLGGASSPAEPDDAALLIYTSGTTGCPKGALQTHGGSLHTDQLSRNAMNIDTDDVHLALMPFFHQAGLIRTRATILAGGLSVIPGKLPAQDTAEAIARSGATFTMLASPAQHQSLLNMLKTDGSGPFSRLRMLLGGGGLGARTMATLRILCESLDCVYFGVYGQTETTGPATYITGEDAFLHPDSCGQPFPGLDITIWDSNCEPMPVGATGEIAIRGAVTARYWANNEANTSLYEGEWIHTGDLGYLDEDGFLYIVGRLKELIKTGAENVYPREVEAVLEAHPQIADVAVFGIPDSTWGELVCAGVVTQNADPLDTDLLRDFCRGKIAGYKIPKKVVIVESIPRNHTGKVIRWKLAASAGRD